MAKDEKMFYNTGEKPKNGTYYCAMCCNTFVRIPEEAKRLPECPDCGYTQWCISYQ